MLISALLFFPFFHFHPIFWLISLFLYFLPAFLARNKPNFTGVLVLNILAGWTFIGWIIALVWALSGPAQGQSTGPAPAATANPSQPASFFCSTCGKRCAAGATFCSSCGAALPSTQH